MKDAKELQKLLRNIQEPLGYLFNRNQEQVDSLLQGLLTNGCRNGVLRRTNGNARRLAV